MATACESRQPGMEILAPAYGGRPAVNVQTPLPKANTAEGRRELKAHRATASCCERSNSYRKLLEEGRGCGE